MNNKIGPITVNPVPRAVWAMDVESRIARSMARNPSRRKFGNVCKHHPEWRGFRRVSDDKCIPCKIEQESRRGGTPSGLKKSANYVRRRNLDLKAEVMTAYGGKCDVCQKHLVWLRETRNAT